MQTALAGGKKQTTALAGEGKQADRPSGVGNAPLLPPAAASPPEGEIFSPLLLVLT